MTQKEQIKHFKLRANCIDAMGGWSEKVEDAYWQLKEDMFKAETLWEYANPRFYWAQEMKDALFEIFLILENVWHKKFA